MVSGQPHVDHAGTRRRGLLVGAALLAVLALTAVIAFRWGASDQSPPVITQPTASAEGPDELTVAEIYQTLAPSVVFIRSTSTSAAIGTGTGLIVNADGAILTALHVVEGSASIEVSFADGTSSAAEIVGATPAIDIALLLPTTLPEIVVPAVLGGGVGVGDDVVAIGNPLGLRYSTTSGVVSGLDRTIAREGADDIEGVIQFDAAVNPGSSGGPLLNARGEAVGIVVALANPTEAGTFIGVGFAVPIGQAVAAGSGPPPLL